MDPHDEDEFAEFVRSQQATLFRTAYLLQGDYQRAEDALQSAFTKVYLHWPRIRKMEHPAAYARRILVNDTSSWWRRRSSHERVSEIDLDRSLPGPDETTPAQTATWAAILQLPPRQRAVIVLRYYEDLSEQTTAQILGIAVGTVKSHTHAAHQRLAALMGDTSEITARGSS
jgi:RNA polymerase sigma-70 factor (sigma-E family)